MDVIDALLLLNYNEITALLLELLKDFFDGTHEGINFAMVPANFKDKIKESIERGRAMPSALLAYLLTCLSDETPTLREISYRVADFRASESITAPAIAHDQKWLDFLRFCKAKRINYLMLDHSSTTSSINHVTYVEECQAAWKHLKMTGQLPVEKSKHQVQSKNEEMEDEEYNFLI